MPRVPAAPAHLVEVARAAARSHAASSPFATAHRTADPIPIEGPAGHAGWLVGVVAHDRLLGFVQFGASGREVRTSWFPARTSLDECPLAATWLDPATIAASASGQASPGETLGMPVLTYDRDPGRLLWRVPTLRRGRRTGSI